jgi:hypothetical protein
LPENSILPNESIIIKEIIELDKQNAFQNPTYIKSDDGSEFRLDDAIKI